MCLNLEKFFKDIFIKASCRAGAQTCDYKRDRFWVRITFKEKKYLIFSFTRADN